MTNTVVPAILCGGSGTRLWPISRTHEPKQLQVLFGEHSLLTHTALRLKSDPSVQPPLIICGSKYADEVARQLNENGVTIGAIIEEPMGRDTAAAAAIAARWVRDTHGEGAVMVLLPADHFVGNLPAFHDALSMAAQTASRGYISTIGIRPDRPETGFGYILRQDESLGSGAFPVERFVEKPNLETAGRYMEHGGYHWNAGIFALTGTLYLEELAKFEPEIHASAHAAYDDAETQVLADGSTRLRLKPESFGRIPKKSIDYAVMENTQVAAVVPADFDWSDVGSWTAVRDLAPCDGAGNVLEGDVTLINTRDCFVKSDAGRVVGMVGLEGVIVVDSPDALLVCANSAAQDIKKVHQNLVGRGHAAAVQHASQEATLESRCRSWARDWLFKTALPFWAEHGEDRQFGGVHEALDMTGNPITHLPKRFRVQARQVYSFSHAYTLGWDPGLEALRAPLDFMLEKCRHPDGGWVHTLTPDGEILDGALDTYDQAFALLGLGWAYKVTGEQELLQAARQTLRVLKQDLRHPGGGYLEGLPARSPRRANPHMHLFECALHWMELHDDGEMAALADEIFELYEGRFCINGILREYFNDDLSPLSRNSDPALLAVEPGHLLEWAFLLRKYADLTGRNTETVATLEAFADRFGMSHDTGLVMDQCAPDGRHPTRITSRLWPQTEYIRLKLTQDDPVQQRKGYEMLERVKAHYLDVNGEVGGIWADQVDGQGNRLSSQAPASTLYHLMGCLVPLL